MFIDHYGLEFGFSDAIEAVNSAIERSKWDWLNDRWALGGGTGAVMFGPFGGVAGGFIGGTFGSVFDPAGAGQLNYGENDALNYQNTMNEAEEILQQAKTLNNKIDNYCRHTGGCNYDASCN